MKGYEGLKHPFIMIIAYILMSYIEFMNGEGLTNEFIDIAISKKYVSLPHDYKHSHKEEVNLRRV